VPTPFCLFCSLGLWGSRTVRPFERTALYMELGHEEWSCLVVLVYSVQIQTQLHAKRNSFKTAHRVNHTTLRLQNKQKFRPILRYFFFGQKSLIRGTWLYLDTNSSFFSLHIIDCVQMGVLVGRFAAKMHRKSAKNNKIDDSEVKSRFLQEIFPTIIMFLHVAHA